MKKTPVFFGSLFGDISDGRDKAHMSKQPASFSFSTKLTLGKRLGWAGLKLLSLGCLFGVTILWKFCGQTTEGKNASGKNVTQETSGIETNVLSAIGIFTSPLVNKWKMEDAGRGLNNTNWKMNLKNGEAVMWPAVMEGLKEGVYWRDWIYFYSHE